MVDITDKLSYIDEANMLSQDYKNTMTYILTSLDDFNDEIKSLQNRIQHIVDTWGIKEIVDTPFDDLQNPDELDWFDDVDDDTADELYDRFDKLADEYQNLQDQARKLYNISVDIQDMIDNLG